MCEESAEVGGGGVGGDVFEEEGAGVGGGGVRGSVAAQAELVVDLDFVGGGRGYCYFEDEEGFLGGGRGEVGHCCTLCPLSRVVGG